MDFDELKKDIRNIEYELEYGEEQHLGKIAVDVNCLRSVIDFANAAIARQSVKSEEVAEAIEWHKDCLQYYKDDDKAIRAHYGGDLPSWIDESIKASNISITALQAYQPWNSISDPPLKNGKYLLYAPKFIYEGCEYSETLDIGLYHDGLGFSMPNCFPEPKATHWLEIRKPHEVEL